MSDEKKDVLDKWGKTVPIKKSDPEKSDWIYKAVGIDKSRKEQIRFDVRDYEGNSWLYSYSYITRILFTGNALISIVATDSIITLEGDNLQKLKPFLQDNQASYLQEFNSNRWTHPAKEDPIIRKIEILEPTIRTQKDEES